MTEVNPRAKKKKITYVASLTGVEKAELALRRLGIESKLNFAKSRILSRSTVTKFFKREPIQLDSFKRICEALTLDWQTIAEASAENEDIKQINKKRIESVYIIEDEAESVPTIARKVTVVDDENQEIKTAAVILEGDFNSVQKDVLIWHNYLSKKYPGSTIKVKIIKPGSIKLIIEGSQKDIEMLLADFELGKLIEIEGFAIEDIQVLSESAEDDKSSEQKWRLVEEIGSGEFPRRNLGGADLSDADLSNANLSHANLINADLSGADLSSADLRRANLSGANLSSADLSSADLSSADLRSTHLSSAHLRSTHLRSADLRSADLRSTHLRSADLRSADLRSADLRSADLSGADLSGADLSGADLSGADLSGTNLSGADLSGAYLMSANLSRANLSRANLSSAYLMSANLSRADLSRAHLMSANLSSAYLMSADLSRANLSRADLSSAHLMNADLSSAYFMSADLSRAHLMSADLSRAHLMSADLIDANLDNAQMNSTRFGYNSGISKKMKQGLIKQGAIFEDSPNARSANNLSDNKINQKGISKVNLALLEGTNANRYRGNVLLFTLVGIVTVGLLAWLLGIRVYSTQNGIEIKFQNQQQLMPSSSPQPIKVPKSQGQ